MRFSYDVLWMYASQKVSRRGWGSCLPCENGSHSVKTDDARSDSVSRGWRAFEFQRVCFFERSLQITLSLLGGHTGGASTRGVVKERWGKTDDHQSHSPQWTQRKRSWGEPWVVRMWSPSAARRCCSHASMGRQLPQWIISICARISPFSVAQDFWSLCNGLHHSLPKIGNTAVDATTLW